MYMGNLDRDKAQTRRTNTAPWDCCNFVQ